MEKAYVYEKEYVEQKLLAYIGNKRRLLNLILQAIKEIEKREKSVHSRQNRVFIDYFAGTGVVSRLAKSLGYQVISNDWERYSYIINKSFLENSDELFSLYEEEGGFKSIIKKLNDLKDLKKKPAYLSTYYCPKDDACVDLVSERLFYTRANGILIDNIRQAIEDDFPLEKKKEMVKKNYFLLSLLLLEASKRSNTSGVFKGFHQGFGGKKKDALNRILSHVSLSIPKMSSQKNRCKVFQANALNLAKKLSFFKADIVYLDPPYNQHQYGSNYHLLNTIALNDKPFVNKNFFINGKKIDKSAIRKDWVKTKSGFCYKKSARDEFEILVKRIRSKYLLVSYSTEGIILFDEMLAILANKGKVGIVTSSYTRYRGGRQSNTTKVRNIEFILIVDTKEVCTQKDLVNIKGVIIKNSFWNIAKETFPIYKQDENVVVKQVKERVEVTLKQFEITFSLTGELKITASFFESISLFSYEKQKEIYHFLNDFLNHKNSDEVKMICRYLNESPSFTRNNYFFERMVRLYNKINPKKDEAEFIEVSRLLSTFYEKISLSKKNQKTESLFNQVKKIKKEFFYKQGLSLN